MSEQEKRAALSRPAPDNTGVEPVSPQPQLSDEDREALEAKAERFEEHAERCRPVAGTDLATTSLQEAAETIRDLLRKLASQPQQQRCGGHEKLWPVGEGDVIPRPRCCPGCPDCQPQQHGEVEEDAG